MERKFTERELYVTDGEYSIFPIVDEDREDYVELCRQINGEDTYYLDPYLKDMMWEQTLKEETKIFSIFDSSGEYCGSIEVQKPSSDTPEIGIDLLESRRNKGIAAKAVKMVAKRTYEERKVEYFVIRILSGNLHSKHVFEKMGVILIGEEESEFTLFMKGLKKIVGNKDISDITNKLKKRFGETKEEEVVYKYKLTPEIFS